MLTPLFPHPLLHQKNNHKKVQVQRAYKQFLLAQSYHNPDAQYQIRVIETKKEYNKYLDK